jgi:hypothetical protein
VKLKPVYLILAAAGAVAFLAWRRTPAGQHASAADFRERLWGRELATQPDFWI